jgi:hypothetical protein
MNGSLAFAILYDLFWLGIMGILYWRRIFIAVVAGYPGIS